MNESFKEPNQNNEEKKGISRRDFLKGAGAAIGVLLSGTYNTGPDKDKVSLPKDTKKSEAEPALEPHEVIPEKITVSKIKKDFTPYPDYYGGEGYQISFIVELKLNNRECINFYLAFGGKIENEGTSKNQKEILEGENLHKILNDIGPKKVRVVLDDIKVIKISTNEKVLWEHK